MIGRRDHGGGAGGSHGDGGLVGLHIDDAFDGDFIGLEFLDDVDEMRADRRERRGLWDGLWDRNHIEGEHGGFARIALEHRVTGIANGRINGEDAHFYKGTMKPSS